MSVELFRDEDQAYATWLAANGRVLRAQHPAHPGPGTCERFSLYDDPSAELHEDASAGLCEHLALPSLLHLAPVLARRPVCAATSIPLTATMRAPWPITESNRFLADTALRIGCRLFAGIV